MPADGGLLSDGTIVGIPFFMRVRELAIGDVRCPDMFRPRRRLSIVLQLAPDTF
jgi:hypothetical protein